jgi:aspartyl-tRNA(Asn)/glutamyl-tRNA(Gln) amidotransferase subunit B
VEKALEYEAARQIKLLKNGQAVVQETLLFDGANGTTQPMRGKEESSDYRYFPDPDLPPLQISESWIKEIRSKLPKLPEQRYHELIEVYGLSGYDAGVLTAEREFADYFEGVFNACSNAKAASNWITTELFGLLRKNGLEILHSPISARNLGELIRLIDQETISGKMAKSVFEEMFAGGEPPAAIVERKGLRQITGEEEVLAIVRQVLAQSQPQLKDCLEGNEKVLGYFVGQVMKLSGGSANPKTVNQLLRKEIERIKSERNIS